MSCSIIQPLLEPFFDQACTIHESEVVIAHLSTCTACNDTLRTLEIENRFYARYAERVDLAPPLSRITFRTTTRTRATSEARSRAPFVRPQERWRMAPRTVAVAMVLAVCLTGTLTKYFSSEERQPEPTASSQPVSAATTTPVSKPSSTSPVNPVQESLHTGRARMDRPRPGIKRNRESAFDLVREAEGKYLAAIAILERDAVRNRAQFDDETRTHLELTLASIDRAIASTRKAVKAAPGDPVALQYMLAAYSRKVDLLRQMIAD